MRESLSRRDVLAGIGTAGLGTIATGVVSGRTAPKGEYNVGIATPAAERAARQAAKNVSRAIDWEDGTKTLTLTLPDEALKGLQNRRGVRYVEQNGLMHAIAQTTPWGIDRVDADKVHADGETGGDNTDGEGGADIAIIDTGIDDDHPDLQANVGAGKAYVDCQGSNCNYAWSDDNDHGTHCAGIADAVDNSEGVVGVSTEATLHAVKVLAGDGSGTFSDVASGIKYVADQGWDVASLSLGASSGSDTVKDAVRYAYDNGVLLVGSAGNSGPCSDCVGYPAAYKEVIAVSSTDSDDTLSSFSSTGSEVELAAPGGSIYSTVIGGYDTFSGTSMSCPHVSGAAAQLMDNDYTNTEARDQLNSTAEDIGLASNEQGNGLLDVKAAVGGSSDSAPSVSWVTPADEDTVSGTVTVQIDATDSEDSNDTLDVTYTVDGGSTRSTTYTSAGYYEDSWDTTTVSDGSHTLEATATDSAGNTTTSTTSVTTDNTESAPAVDSLSLSEVETSDGDAEFDAAWQVSDDDGDLSSVDLVLTQDSDGSTEDSATVSVSGSSASGTSRLVAAGDDGSGNSYTVELTVTDGAGQSSSDTASATETEETSSAPTIETHAISEAGSPNPHLEISVDWGVSDSDGDLSTVTVVAEDADGSAFSDTRTNSVSGSSASGSESFKFKKTRGETADVTITASDAAGNSTSHTEQVSE